MVLKCIDGIRFSVLAGMLLLAFGTTCLQSWLSRASASSSSRQQNSRHNPLALSAEAGDTDGNEPGLPTVQLLVQELQPCVDDPSQQGKASRVSERGGSDVKGHWFRCRKWDG